MEELAVVQISQVSQAKWPEVTMESIINETLSPVSNKVATWQDAVALKQSQSKAAIPTDWLVPPSILAATDLSLTSTTNLIKINIVRHCGILSDHELEITESYDAGQILAKLAKRELSALEVTIAFSKRAAIAQQLLSCVTEMFFERAQERAQFLDDYLEREGKVYGPLHGLPISLKDSFNVAGIQSTIGYVSFLDHPLPNTNSALVDLLLRLGAVLYVKTNIPQTLMTADSENNIFGRTRNPRKLNLTAGGSSGGEGSLVAFRGSILGIGTDVAGSIRIPSLCCGTYGFKPTANRIPYGRQTSPSLPGLPSIVPAAGPLATTVADLKVFFKSVLDAKPWRYDDSTAWAVPYQNIDEEYPATTSLTIGILAEDPLTPLQPPVRRALDNAVSALVAAGHTLVQIPPNPDLGPSTAWELALKLFSIDPLKTSIKHIRNSGEPMINTVAMGPPTRDGNFRKHEYSIANVADLNVRRNDYCEGWREIFLKHGLDVVIAPGAQHTAVTHDTYGPPEYTTMWNLLDYPACIIPYGEASMSLDPQSVAQEVVGGISPKYDAAAVDGAPTAIQIIAPRFQDELCLKASEIIDQEGQVFSRVRDAANLVNLAVTPLSLLLSRGTIGLGTQYFSLWKTIGRYWKGGYDLSRELLMRELTCRELVRETGSSKALWWTMDKDIENRSPPGSPRTVRNIQ